ncbi:MAG TPA: flagellar hook assembly protein FlgD [Gammaproteobacteria bacterium]|nr:flagellar hook assembly protein FlgD [Gammaproteobacteria bacterium]
MVAINTDILDKYQLGKNTQKNDPAKILQGDFLKLMTEQLKHQDPMKPTDNGEFLGQMAQFSTVSGLKELQGAFTKLANTLQSNQMLMAATLIDKQALVPAETITTTEKGEKVSGAVALPESSANASVDVIDAGGNVIRTLPIKASKDGGAEFTWDGKNADGEEMPPGHYRFQASVALDDKGAVESAPLYLDQKITSISVDQGNISVTAGDGAKYGFADILRIG